MYGITPPEAYELLRPRLCDLCQRTPGFHIEHNHETGEIRGVLCGTCNSGLGMMGDPIEILKLAIKYLEKQGTYGGVGRIDPEADASPGLAAAS